MHRKEYIFGVYRPRRDEIAAQNEALSARKHPEALKDDDAQTIQSNTDMISLLDDQIEEAAKGQDYVYKVHTDEDGTPHYTKQMEGGQPQEITEGHYDLKNANDDWANSQGGVFVPDFPGEAPEPTLHPILGIPRDHVRTISYTVRPLLRQQRMPMET